MKIPAFCVNTDWCSNQSHLPCAQILITQTLFSKLKEMEKYSEELMPGWPVVFVMKRQHSEANYGRCVYRWKLEEGDGGLAMCTRR